MAETSSLRFLALEKPLKWVSSGGRYWAQSLQYAMPRATQITILHALLQPTLWRPKQRLRFKKTSMFPAAGPFSGAMFHGGQFNITINTVNKSPGTYADGLISTERSYIRIKRILESSDDDGSPTLHRKTLPLTGFLKNIIRVIDFIMNKACLEFCRAT